MMIFFLYSLGYPIRKRKDNYRVDLKSSILSSTCRWMADKSRGAGWSDALRSELNALHPGKSMQPTTADLLLSCQCLCWTSLFFSSFSLSTLFRWIGGPQTRVDIGCLPTVKGYFFFLSMLLSCTFSSSSCIHTVQDRSRKRWLLFTAGPRLN